MKKLMFTSMFVISFLTATATQLSKDVLYSINDTITKKEITTTPIDYYPIIVVEEEQDEPFEFNTKDYLPVGFNPYKSTEQKYNIEYELALEEEDEPFDFNTKDYLPVGFNLKKEILDTIVEISIEEVDEPFDFDTKKYLPKGFDPNKKSVRINEI